MVWYVYENKCIVCRYEWVLGVQWTAVWYIGRLGLGDRPWNLWRSLFKFGKSEIVNDTFTSS